MSTAQFANMTRAQAVAFMANAHPQPVRHRLAQIVGGRAVIDIGCGKGEEIGDLFTPEQYTGVDCSAELIAIAQKRWPEHRFFVGSAQGTAAIATLEPRQRWPFGIIKSVLEHLPPDEAVAVYEAGRAICDVLLVAWHTEPGWPEKLGSYDGELGRMLQHRHTLQRFTGIESREVCGAHVIWTVRP